MAVTVQSVTGTFDPATRDIVGRAQVISLAIAGATKKPRETDPAKRKRVVTAQNQLMNAPDFVVFARSTIAEGPTSVLELISKGVTFPAATGSGATLTYYERVITVDAYLSAAAGGLQGFLRATGTIIGGTTPTVLVTTVQGPSAVAAFTATPAVTFSAGASVLNINITSAQVTTIVNWVLNVRIGKLQSVLGGV